KLITYNHIHNEMNFSIEEGIPIEECTCQSKPSSQGDPNLDSKYDAKHTTPPKKHLYIDHKFNTTTNCGNGIYFTEEGRINEWITYRTDLKTRRRVEVPHYTTVKIEDRKIKVKHIILHDEEVSLY